ncbi:MAG: N-acetylmuramoyl-L-alanine amidase [Saprospiraceae bacterium]|nr:N-acetylmuramoyl-L-alanine amidase [Saprospiraceae bacterium]
MENYDFRPAGLLVMYFILFMVSSPVFSMFNNDPKVQLIGTYTVVLDAGHGGHDSGAKGKSCLEKEINLSVCKLTAELLRDKMPNSRIVFTREDDQFVSLQKRAQAANQNKAGLFVSIHCNAHKDRTIRGSETYIMGLHKTAENLEVAQTENAIFLHELESENIQHNTPESHILMSHYLEQNLMEGLRFAEDCENKFGVCHPGGSRGVRQAGFLVLHQVVIPAVLVELGYLSHPEEEQWLCSAEGQCQLAQALADSIVDYFAKKEFLARKN